MSIQANFPTYDKWGILNWARAKRHLWNVAPCARKVMIRDAAVRRWRAHYQHRNSVFDFLDYADWLHDNLAAETAGAEGWT